MKAAFVVFEGLDRSGKTTISQKFATDLFPGQTYNSFWTSEPDNTSAAGDFIRKVLQKKIPCDPWTLALAFATNRADHCRNVIKPFLKGARVVVCDRYLMSNLVYQQADGINSYEILQLNRACLKPDLTIYLRATPDTCRQRLKARGASPERFDNRLDRLNELYDTEVERSWENGDRISVVNAERSIDQVMVEVMAIWKTFEKSRSET